MGKSFSSAEKLAVHFHPLVHAATPSARMMVHAQGKLRLNLAWGDDFEFYDLASLTKIIFTTTSFMQLASVMGAERILEIPVWQSLPELKWKSSVADHLKHQAGCTWWKPYYKELVGITDPQKQMQKMISLLAKESKRAGRHAQKAMYSDFDFWILGLMLGRWLSSDWGTTWEKLKESLPKNEMHFNPVSRRGSVERNRVTRMLAKSKYAPTEKCPWRNRILQGEVHDENAWAMGGVAPHAGLFGRAEDVAAWGLELRDAFLGKPNALNLDQKTVQLFSTRQMPAAQGDFALGFMKPTAGTASCGPRISAASIGHTGFTGTSWWWDPQHDVMVTLLSNRVHPTRENNGHIEMRRALHTAAFEFCEAKKWIRQ